MAIWIVLPILTLLMFDLGLAAAFRLPPVLLGIGLVLMLLPVLLGIGRHYAWPRAAEKTDKVLGNLRKRDKKLEGCLRIC